jgi:hypothetical protein
MLDKNYLKKNLDSQDAIKANEKQKKKKKKKHIILQEPF